MSENYTLCKTWLLWYMFRRNLLFSQFNRPVAYMEFLVMYDNEMSKLRKFGRVCPQEMVDDAF